MAHLLPLACQQSLLEHIDRTSFVQYEQGAAPHDKARTV